MDWIYIFRQFDFQAKVELANELSVGDLTTMCDIRAWNFEDSRDQLKETIIRELMDISLLASNDNEKDCVSDQICDKEEVNVIHKNDDQQKWKTHDAVK